MTVEADSVRVIASWPKVEPLLDQAREACTALRWHQALRRRIPEAAAESRVRGAHASAELDGARSSLATVRDLMRGALDRSTQRDPAQLTVLAAVQATAESEHVGGLVRTSGAQVLARLHTAAGSLLLPQDQLGRPRRAGETSPEFTELGDPPADPDEIQARLRGIVDLMSLVDVPSLVVASLVHAEIVTVRPFVRGNGLVARALERALTKSSGLDPTGVAVPEKGHHTVGQTAYLGALTAYGTGSAAGVGLWVQHCARAMIIGAQEGNRIADAVLVGRLSPEE